MFRPRGSQLMLRIQSETGSGALFYLGQHVHQIGHQMVSNPNCGQLNASENSVSRAVPSRVSALILQNKAK